jgi:glutamate carboxypeptidase
MKGGLVVVAFALRGLAEAYPRPRRAPPLRIVVVSDEEVGSPEGAGHPPLHRRQRRGAGLRVRSGAGRDHHPAEGHGNVSVVGQGAAHAGNAHAEGKNAIWAVARWVDAASSSPTTSAASP